MGGSISGASSTIQMLLRQPSGECGLQIDSTGNIVATSSISGFVPTLGQSSNPWPAVYSHSYPALADFYFMDYRKNGENIENIDDLSILNAIKPSGEFCDKTGFSIIDDWSLPTWIFCHKKKSDLLKEKKATEMSKFIMQFPNGLEEKWKEIELNKNLEQRISKGKIPLEISNLLKAEKAASKINNMEVSESEELVLALNEQGKPYLDLVTIISLLMGAVRQLDKKIEGYINKQ